MRRIMWSHPVTKDHLEKLVEWGYKVIQPTSKLMPCGDVGTGAMAKVQLIVEKIKDEKIDHWVRR